VGDDEASVLGSFGIDDIRRAADRIAPHIVRTPVQTSIEIDRIANTRVFAKAEALQTTGSFKFRGALNKVLGFEPGALTRGIVGFSAGNHAAAIAAAGAIVGCPVVVVIPQGAPAAKIANCRAWGAEVIPFDPARQDREQIAAAVVSQRGMTLVPPFDDYDIMAGAGTVGLDIADDLHGRGVIPDVVVVNCSGGGLASGVLTVMEHYYPSIQKYIVEPAGHDKMARSLAAGMVLSNPPGRTTLMDGINGPVVGRHPLEVLRRLNVTPLQVNDDQALRAVAAAHEHFRLVVEPAGAASLAAVLFGQTDFAGRNIALVNSGGNVDSVVYRRALQLADSAHG
jgi:threonine dehydratase